MMQSRVDTVLERVKTRDRNHKNCSMENPLGLYSLGEACEKFFPGLNIDARDLKKEARRGRLKLIRIGKQLCVSEEAIREMLNSCQEKQNHQGSCSKIEGETAKPIGSLSTADERSAQVAAETTLKELVERLKPTSQAAGKLGRKATPRGSSSRTF
jgi:hypothetical protein